MKVGKSVWLRQRELGSGLLEPAELKVTILNPSTLQINSIVANSRVNSKAIFQDALADMA